MNIIAYLSKTKAFSGVAFLGGASVFILSQPFWQPGGLPALLSGANGSRYWWPILAVAALVILPLAMRALIRAVRHPGPAVFVQDAALHCSNWPSPVALADIVGLEVSRFGILPRSQPMVTVTIAGGSIRSIHTMNLTPDTETIGRAIANAADLPEKPPR